MLDSWFLPVIEAGMAVLALALFVILCLACEAGFQLGRWRGRRITRSEAENSAVSGLTGGMLALLAFMLGLTVSFAQGRYEARRDLVVTEANVIGTAWMRARLVGGPEGEAMARLIGDYARVRLAFTAEELSGPIETWNARTSQIGEQIWSLATVVARRSPTPVTATLITAINEMFDASLSQRQAFEGGVPPGILTLLVFGSVLAIGALGFQLGLVGQRQFVLSALLLAMWVGGIVMTVDLNRPRLGDVRVDPAPLHWVIGEMAAAPPAGPSAAP